MKARREVEKIKPYTPGKPVEEVKRALGLHNVYKLASNEIPFAPLYAQKALREEVKSLNRYPESGCFYLRKALSKKMRVRADQIVFGNGSDELITLTLRAFVEKGDEIVVAYPTFLIYEIQGQVQGARIRRVPLRNFRYDLEGIARVVTKNTKVVFIANPDNPSGTYVNHKEMKRFLYTIPQTVLVFLDEAYFEFAPQDFPRSKEFLQKRGNIIFTRTFSKAYGLAGLRIGYGITTPALAQVLGKVREPFNVNRCAQVAAREELADKLQDPALQGELAAFDAEIDQVALYAFDVYTKCRDRLHELRVDDVKRRVSGLMRRMGIGLDDLNSQANGSGGPRTSD